MSKERLTRDAQYHRDVDAAKADLQAGDAVNAVAKKYGFAWHFVNELTESAKQKRQDDKTARDKRDIEIVKRHAKRQAARDIAREMGIKSVTTVRRVLDKQSF